MSAPWTFRPSNLLLSLPSGSKVPSLKLQRILLTRHFKRREKAGDFLTMRTASDHISLAWSRFVAAE